MRRFFSLQTLVMLPIIALVLFLSAPAARARGFDLGIRHHKLSAHDQQTGLAISICGKCRTRPRTADSTGLIGDDDSCNVTVFRKFCHNVSNYPVPIEQCYWIPEHHSGKWDKKHNCCAVVVDGMHYCVKGAGQIYLPW